MFRRISSWLSIAEHEPTTLEQRNRKWLAIWRYKKTLNMIPPDVRREADRAAAETYLRRKRRAALRFLSKSTVARQARIKFLRETLPKIPRLSERSARKR